jgi:hypothetical protein
MECFTRGCCLAIGIVDILFGCDASPEDVCNGDETGYFFRALPSTSLATRCRKGMKVAKDRITAMLCCNATGTDKMDLLIIGTAKQPRCFGKTWKPAYAHIIYEYNKSAWMDGEIFARWIIAFNNKQKRKFQVAGQDKKAWLLLDNSSTHVLPEGVEQCIWEVDGFKLRGFQMSHTNVAFLLPNTTSACQPMDGGIIANTKVKTRKKYVQWLLEMMDGCPDSTPDKFKPDIRQAMMWMRDSWREVTPETIKNCWLHVGILQTAAATAAAASVLVPIADTVLDELKALLLEFGAVSGDGCTAEELINIPAERWTEAPDSSDDECELTLAMAECAELTDAETQEDDSVEPPSMSLKEARAASSALLMFLEENKCEDAASHQGTVSAALGRLNMTVRHSQGVMPRFFPPAAKPGPL